MAEQHNHVQELHSLLLPRDASTAVAIVHRMRGAAGNLALPQLQAVLERLETAAHAQDPAGFDQQLPALGTALAQVEALLRASEALGAPPMAPAGHAAAQPTQRSAHTQAALQKLANSLHHGEIHDRALQHLVAALPPAEMAALQAAIDLFDLDQALRCVQALIATDNSL